MLRRFRSLSRSHEFGYAYDSDAYDSRTCFNSHFRVYQTYGHDLVQHSTDWTVNLEQIIDFLASLATELISDFDKGETSLYDRIGYDFTQGPSRKDIEFAASVKYKSTDSDWGKRRYVSMKERKLSSSASKENDKRYEEVKEWMDGSPRAICRLVTPDYADNLMAYRYAEVVRDYVISQPGLYMEMPAEHLNWWKDDPNQRDKCLQMNNAFRACQEICQAFQHRERAKSCLENYTRNLEREEESRKAKEVERAETQRAS